MNVAKKRLLIILGALFGSGLCLALTVVPALRSAGRLLAQAIDSDPAAVTAIGAGIAGYTLPAGYGQGVLQ